MLIDGLPSLNTAASGDEIPIERGTATYKISYSDLFKDINVTGGITASGTLHTGNGTYVDSGFDYSETITEARSKVLAAILDLNLVNRGQVYCLQNPSGSYATMLQARDGQGTQCYIGAAIDQNGSPAYYISDNAAFRSALNLSNVNNSLVLTATTGSGLYTQLNALPASPDNGAGVPCYMSNAALKLLTGNTNLSGAFHGVITRASTTRYRTFGMYADTAYIMYWAFDIASNGTITPLTVYKLQGTAM